jgi:hypothetical protein
MKYFLKNILWLNWLHDLIDRNGFSRNHNPVKNETKIILKF